MLTNDNSFISSNTIIGVINRIIDLISKFVGLYKEIKAYLLLAFYGFWQRSAINKLNL